MAVAIAIVLLDRAAPFQSAMVSPKAFQWMGTRLLVWNANLDRYSMSLGEVEVGTRCVRGDSAS